MSIISDALQKAQSMRGQAPNEKDQLAVPASVSPAVPGPGPIVENGSKRSFPIIAAGSIIVFVVIAAAFFFMKNSGQQVQAAPKSQANDKPAALMNTSAQNNPASPALPAVITGKKFPVLNGIMYTEGNPQAVLDGKPLGEGASVNGFIVKKISPEEVVLKSGNKEYTLRIKL